MLDVSTMPSIGIETLPLFIYKILDDCNNKTLTQLISVSVKFSNWFKGSHLKKFRIYNHLHLVTYWPKGLLSERSPRSKTPTPLYIYGTSPGLRLKNMWDAMVHHRPLRLIQIQVLALLHIYITMNTRRRTQTVVTLLQRMSIAAHVRVRYTFKYCYTYGR